MSTKKSGSKEPSTQESHCTGIWLDKKLHIKAKAKAKSMGLSVSSYLRMLANRDINGSKA